MRQISEMGENVMEMPAEFIGCELVENQSVGTSPYALRQVARENWFIRMAEEFSLVPAPNLYRGTGTLIRVLYPKVFQTPRTTQRWVRLMPYEKLGELELMDIDNVHEITASIYIGRYKRTVPITVWVDAETYPTRDEAEAHLAKVLPARSVIKRPL